MIQGGFQTKKQLLLLLLSFCLVLGLVGALMPAARAGQTPTEGNLGDTITWRFDPETGILSLSGTGEIRHNSSEEDAPWEAWIPQITAVEVGDGITSVGYSVFAGLEALERVELPDGITYIGRSAFSNCIMLEEVELPEGVTKIDNDAFSGSGITRINIPKSVEEIGESAFYYCLRLEQISIPAKTHTIGKDTFLLCDSLRSIDVAAGNSWYSSRGSGALMNKEGTRLLRVPGGIGVEFVVPDGVEYIAPVPVLH